MHSIDSKMRKKANNFTMKWLEFFPLELLGIHYYLFFEEFLYATIKY